MNNKDFKKKLNKAYENKTPDVYSKVRKTPINYNVFIESPEQAKKRKIVLILICMLFAILAVLVVSLFSFMIPPSNGKQSSSPNVYANITVNGENFGVVIDEPSNALVCLMNENTKTNIDVKDKTINDIWALINVQTGNTLSITTYADGYDQMDKVNILLQNTLQNYCVDNSIGITVTSSNIIMASHLTEYINQFGKTQVSMTDAPSTIITTYIYVSATNENV